MTKNDNKKNYIVSTVFIISFFYETFYKTHEY